MQLKNLLTRLLIINESYHRPGLHFIQSYISRSKCKELMKGITSQSYLGHARKHARMFPKSINMLIRLLPRKLNARRRQGLKEILIQGHRD